MKLKFIEILNISQFCSFLGIEYRFIKELTRLWSIEHQILPPFSWAVSQDDVQHGLAEVGLCSAWVTRANYERLDLTSHIDYQCATYLVPKTTPLLQATFIYLSLDSNVWLAFGFCFIVTWTLLTYFSIFSERNHFYPNQAYRYITASRSFIDMMTFMTSQGIVEFPRQKTIQIVLFR